MYDLITYLVYALKKSSLFDNLKLLELAAIVLPPYLKRGRSTGISNFNMINCCSIYKRQLLAVPVHSVKINLNQVCMSNHCGTFQLLLPCNNVVFTFLMLNVCHSHGNLKVFK